MLIISGLMFFFLVVGFILKQRIFDRGLRLALWWTKFLPSFGDETSAWDMADVVEKGSMSLQSAVETGTVVTSIVSGVAASASSMAAGASETESPLIEQVTLISGFEKTVETSTTTGDLSPSLSEVLETTFSSAESIVASSPSSSPHDEL